MELNSLLPETEKKQLAQEWETLRQEQEKLEKERQKLQETRVKMQHVQAQWKQKMSHELTHIQQERTDIEEQHTQQLEILKEKKIQLEKEHQQFIDEKARARAALDHEREAFKAEQRRRSADKKRLIVGIIVFLLVTLINILVLIMNTVSSKPANSREVSRDIPENINVPSSMVWVPAGTFIMGSPWFEMRRHSDETQHQVSITRDFFIGKYEVTQQEWQTYMSNNPSDSHGSTFPVENISWYEAIAYCNMRSSDEGLKPVYISDGETIIADWEANGYRLPTEAEWEYACRAGTTTTFSTGKTISSRHARFNSNRGQTVSVGTFEPNAWGIFDMHGNVWEWCWDWYGSYERDEQVNPSGPDSGRGRVARGGSYGNYAQLVRSANRASFSATSRLKTLGFRLVRLTS
ncbi:MAG: SUMF1/EgtB/PvdO family nonheme iron enzyme [Treponema sp.]|nr:SUMF1/EgtB/PvdO family nonheme iron enzyme [Treponema sp.]